MAFILSRIPLQESAETKLLRREINRLLNRVAEQNTEINALRDARPSYKGQDSVKDLIREKACSRCTVKLLLAMSSEPVKSSQPDLKSIETGRDNFFGMSTAN